MGELSVWERVNEAFGREWCESSNRVERCYLRISPWSFLYGIMFFSYSIICVRYAAVEKSSHSLPAAWCCEISCRSLLRTKRGTVSCPSPDPASWFTFLFYRRPYQLYRSSAQTCWMWVCFSDPPPVHAGWGWGALRTCPFLEAVFFSCVPVLLYNNI